MAQYVINLREAGTIHKITAEAMKMPHRRRKTCCGWSFGMAVSSVKVCADVASTKRCRKCFLADGEVIAEQMTDDQIEDY